MNISCKYELIFEYTHTDHGILGTGIQLATTRTKLWHTENRQINDQKLIIMSDRQQN